MAPIPRKYPKILSVNWILLLVGWMKINANAAEVEGKGGGVDGVFRNPRKRLDIKLRCETH